MTPSSVVSMTANPTVPEKVGLAKEKTLQSPLQSCAVVRAESEQHTTPQHSTPQHSTAQDKYHMSIIQVLYKHRTSIS